MSRERLIELYQQLSEHTEPECGQCRVPNSCCSPEYCEMTAKIAKDMWGVELERTDHPELPFLRDNKCTVKPHLRPICTLHTCAINSIGCKPGDVAWTEKYFELRDEIERLEAEVFEDFIPGAAGQEGESNEDC